MQSPHPTAAPAPQWSEDYCGGAWLLQTYDDVANALRDPRFSVRRAARWINSGLAESTGNAIAPSPEQWQFKRVFARSLLFVDGRAHRRLRQLLQVGFKPSELQNQAAAISAIADALIRQIQADGSATDGFDFVQRFARPLPALVIARLMGLPAQVPEAFIGWASDLATFIGSPTPDTQQTLNAQQALHDMCEFFLQAMAAYERRAGSESESGTGLLGQIVQARQAQQLSLIEALAQCCTLLFAGYETTRSLLGNGLLALLRHPHQWAALKASPQRLRGAVREMLRYDSPVQYTGRRLLADVDIRGQRLRRGQLAILHIGAANHDPQRFSNPQQFDIGRDQGQHLSFGHGPHVCLGAALTQLEAELAFTALIRAMPDMRLSPCEPRWQQNAAYRALESLPIVVSQQHA